MSQQQPVEDPAVWRGLADAGDPAAQLTRARAYLGRGNVARARRWLQRKIEGGNGDAAVELVCITWKAMGCRLRPSNRTHVSSAAAPGSAVE